MTAPDKFDKTVVMLQSRSEAERYILMQAHPHLIDAALAVIARLTAERDALRRHARSLHRLNGWSKQKGWWCSCGTTIQATSISYDRSNYPGDADGRAEAIGLHVEHVDAALAAGAPVSGDAT